MTHSESATRLGGTAARADAADNRPNGWSAVGAGVVSQSATVATNSAGYRIEFVFKGITAQSTGSLAERPIGATAPAETIAALAVSVRLAGQCTSAAPCDHARSVVSQRHDTMTVAYDYPTVAARSKMIIDALTHAWLRTPEGDTGRNSASVSATVSSITIVPRG